MRQPVLAIFCFFALTACDAGPTFDASSETAYLKSLDQITANLGADDERRLDVAVLTLALGSNTVQSSRLQFANSAALKDLVALNGVANPLLFLDRVRGISGRSASGVIHLVAAPLDEEISRNEAASAAAYKQLGDVAIDHPRYTWDRKRNQPMVAFSVYNGGKSAISRIHLSCVVTVPGRSGKWLTSGLTYKFERGLEPGVAVSVSLFPRVVNVRTAKELENAYDADVSVKVSNIEDPDGRKLIRVDTDILDGMRSKKDFLRGS
jgi:hypothetical protein